VAIQHGERVHARPAVAPRQPSVAVRLHRLLFSGRALPWLAAETAFAVLLFWIGLTLSPYGDRLSGEAARLTLTLTFGLAFAAVATAFGSYDRANRFAYFSVTRISLAAAATATILDLTIHYFLRYEVVGRLTLLYGGAIAAAGVILARAAVTWLVRRQPYRVAVIGPADRVDEVVRHLQDRAGPRVEVTAWTGAELQDRADGSSGLVDMPAEIIVSNQALTDEEAINLAILGLRQNVPVTDPQSFYARLFERIPTDAVSKRWILEQGLARPQAVAAGGKRLFDLVAALLGLALLSPLFVLIFVAIRLSSPGPGLFVQTRQGRYLRPFRMYKFRTMQWNGALASDGFTRPSDARVTRVGRALRRTHLDELPQLVNVVRGEMSLVGPRPEAIDFATRMEAAIPLYELRYLVRPGITGHAQLKHGYAMDTVEDTREKLSYDLYYLCNYSLRMDMQVLLRTVRHLARRSR
jgi:exopolysaccharide biosynthesis polyprenyl glycosylphosphotransferase